VPKYAFGKQSLYIGCNVNRVSCTINRRDGTHTRRESEVRQLNSGGHSAVAAATAQLASLRLDDATSSVFIPSYINTTLWCLAGNLGRLTRRCKILHFSQGDILLPNIVLTLIQWRSGQVQIHAVTPRPTKYWADDWIEKCSDSAVFVYSFVNVTQYYFRVNPSRHLLSLPKMSTTVKTKHSGACWIAHKAGEMQADVLVSVSSWGRLYTVTLWPTFWHLQHVTECAGHHLRICVFLLPQKHDFVNRRCRTCSVICIFVSSCVTVARWCARA